METDYFKILALSKSGIPALLRSPAHFKHEFENEKKQTKQMKRGSLVHLLFFKPHEFNDLYAMYTGPTSGKGSRTAKDAFTEECEKSGLQVVTDKELDEGRAIVDFLKSDRIVQRLIRDGVYEFPFIGEDPKHQVPIKGMFDSISDEFIVDLKTTESTSDLWKRRGFDSHSHIQAAWYIKLGKLLDGKERRFVFVTVDTKPPFEIYVVEPDHSVLKHAEKLCDEALEIFASCYKTDTWKHKPTEISTWTLPKYLRSVENDND